MQHEPSPRQAQPTPLLGVIGGSGLYDLPELQNREAMTVDTPFGSPSGPLVRGTIDGSPVVFLPRHGPGHRYSPTDLPYRANIYALKGVGVTHVVSVSAVGSLKNEVEPLHLLVPDQIIDRTTSRPRTFFGANCVAHVSLGDPYCPHLRQALLHAAGGTGRGVHDGGTYICVEGPQFSTRAESGLYRSWGASVIGMTAMPEARLAREAELSYATLALVTDYDVWHDSEVEVSVEVVIANLAANVHASRTVIRAVLSQGLPEASPICANALAGAIMTAPDAICSDVRARLGILLDRYLPPATGESSDLEPRA